MSRLVLHTGRFRDMGYETIFSGSVPSQAERMQANQLCMDLKRGIAKDGVGIVVNVTDAGRAIEEVLAIMLGYTLPKKEETTLKSELVLLQRDSLPRLLRAAKLAKTVQEAREIMQTGLDAWANHLAPLLKKVQVNAAVVRNSNAVKPSVRKRWSAATIIATFFILLIFIGTLWQGIELLKRQSHDDVTALTHDHDNETVLIGNRENWFSSLDLEAADNLRRMLPDAHSDQAVGSARQAIAQIDRNIEAVIEAIDPVRLDELEKALPPQFGVDMLDFLRSLAAIEPADKIGLCYEPECQPVYSGSEVQTLESLLKLYEMLAMRWAYSTEQIAPPNLLYDVEAYQSFVADSGFRRAEIQLRGELHRLNFGIEATALLDPLRELIDCPIPGQCRANAADKIARSLQH